MKELTNNISDPKESAEVRQIEKQVIHQRLRPKPGQKVWELDLNTGLIGEAKIEQVSATIKGSVHKKIIMRPGCIYEVAINAKNADKKFLRRLATYAVLNNIELKMKDQ